MTQRWTAAVLRGVAAAVVLLCARAGWADAVAPQAVGAVPRAVETAAPEIPALIELPDNCETCDELCSRRFRTCFNACRARGGAEEKCARDCAVVELRCLARCVEVPCWP